VNYRVIWDEQAAIALQQIYDSVLDKEGLVNAIVRIGLELSANPTEAGESRAPNERILFKFPLIAWFHVDERLREVVVFQVRLSRH
jgi:hypothetical protein